FFFSSRRRHTRSKRDWSSDVCSSDLKPVKNGAQQVVVQPSGFFSQGHVVSSAHQTVSGQGKMVTKLPIDCEHGWPAATSANVARSEERRVGKGWRTEVAPWRWRRGRR